MSEALRFDAHRLDYSRHGQTLHVHYPARDAKGNLLRNADNSLVYRGGWAFDHEPETRRNPQSERTKLWTEMLSEPTAISPTTTAHQ